MNKKSIIAIVILAIILVGGIYYTLQDKDDFNDVSEEENDEVQEIPPSNEEIDESNEKDEESEEDSDSPILESDKLAPDFTLTTLGGDQVSLSDYKGKIVMINFWATWCKYCDEEMPDLQRLYDENKDDDFIVLAVNVGESEKIAKDYIEEGGYTFPVLLDEDREVSQRKYFVSAFPTSYYINKDGSLIGAVPGMMTYPQMTQVLEEIRNSEI
ncbi:TlpA family protein disulfide reductase [Clostridium sp. D2Q-14]|uniref:peroxiredoxin family protein n=1 Tax=Anaeromonas gelatinilytica TaxID=2683194 RepID=UPI00193AE0EC|nr:TlpA disulfide reductase family protein [Anaeromonas gelatinilytica]MBS4535153.1 TlpA family protein disulfide reductase [Anaeromonas gelatinilytica]